MAKLIYRTKAPKKGYVFNESFMTHESSGYSDRLPDQDMQRKAMDIVGEDLRILSQKLEELGYDPTRIRFSIHLK
ncbi:hypothetical protein ACR79B_11110 [Sphingobacterium spiritivorum]|uniref:hypothetical protein n=1 Tax=Sphingobacterium spiritivorum TaxID=258 RepID=UPI003DA54D3C